MVGEILFGEKIRTQRTNFFFFNQELGLWLVLYDGYNVIGQRKELSVVK